jgi:hypothetical protein
MNCRLPAQSLEGAPLPARFAVQRGLEKAAPVNTRPNSVTPIIPKNTAMPKACRISAPAPAT